MILWILINHSLWLEILRIPITDLFCLSFGKTVLILIFLVFIVNKTLLIDGLQILGILLLIHFAYFLAKLYPFLFSLFILWGIINKREVSISMHSFGWSIFYIFLQSCPHFYFPGSYFSGTIINFPGHDDLHYKGLDLFHLGYN